MGKAIRSAHAPALGTGLRGRARQSLTPAAVSRAPVTAGSARRCSAQLSPRRALDGRATAPAASQGAEPPADMHEMGDEHPFAAWGHGVPARPALPTPLSGPPRRIWTRQRLVLAAIVLAAAVGGVLFRTLSGAGPGAATPQNPLATVAGSPFTTSEPAGFRLSVSHPIAGVTYYQLTSPSTAAVPLLIQGPPPAGVIVLSITVVSAATVAKTGNDPGAATQTPIQLLPHAVSEPSGAVGVVASVAPHGTSLDGVAAAAVQYSYSYDGVADIQADVFTRNGQNIEGIELDAEPALAAQSIAAMDTILSHWHWASAPTRRGPRTAARSSTHRAPAVHATKPAGQVQASQDTGAEELALTAQLAIETLAIEHRGSYASASPAALHALAPAVQTRPSADRAYLSAVSATAHSYTLTSTSPDGHRFALMRSNAGTLSFTCSPSRGAHGRCVNGAWH